MLLLLSHNQINSLVLSAPAQKLRFWIFPPPSFKAVYLHIFACWKHLCNFPGPVPSNNVSCCDKLRIVRQTWAYTLTQLLDSGYRYLLRRQQWVGDRQGHGQLKTQAKNGLSPLVVGWWFSLHMHKFKTASLGRQSQFKHMCNTDCCATGVGAWIISLWGPHRRHESFWVWEPKPWGFMDYDRWSSSYCQQHVLSPPVPPHL